MQHTRMIRISTQRNTATPHASDPQQLAKELCSLAGLHGNFSSYDLNRFVGSLNSEQARDDLYPLMIRLIRMWAVGKPEGLSGYVMDDCRKICDLMGWAPAQENRA